MQRGETSGTGGPVPRWTVGDVVDFEHLVARDVDPAGIVPTAAEREQEDRAAAFRRWLDGARARAGGLLPGATYDRGLRGLRWVLVVAGLLTGSGLAGALLARHPAEPVNALIFLGVTVGVQVALLLVVATGWALRSRLRARASSGAFADAGLFAIGALGRAFQRFDGERRSRLAAAWAAVDLRSARLAPLVGGELLVTAQLFGIAFNVGLLAALLLVYLPFTELRFGWQSTYSFTTAGVDAAVRIVALPWSWLAPSLAPDPAAIAASRYARGQSATALPAAAATAWWPFLIAAIVVYGLLLRTLLTAVAGALVRRRLSRLAFTSPAAAALWRRMSGPLIASPGSTPSLPDPVDATGVRRPHSAVLLVVDAELAGDRDRVRGRVERTLHATVGQTLVSDLDDDRLDAGLVAALAGSTDVAIAVAAQRDPIVAVADFVRSVRAGARKQADVTLVLVDADAVPDDAGEGANGPVTAGAVATASAARTRIWKRFVAIQRLAVGVETGER